MFEGKWIDLPKRMDIVSGKQTLGQLILYIQDTYGVNLSHAKIIEAFPTDQIPGDLMHLLRDLEDFRATQV